MPLQPRRKRPVLGFVATSSLSGTPEFEAFVDELGRFGYVDASTIEIAYRYGSGESIRASVGELAGAGVDVIFATRIEVIRSAKEATTTIPIVMVASDDPVADGLVVSLAQPGGNVTGLTSLVRELGGKRLELLKAAVPRLSRVGALWNPAETESAIGVGEAQAAAERLGLRLTMYEIRQGPRQVDIAFEAADREGIEALIVTFLPPAGMRDYLVYLAAGRRLPTVFANADSVRAGGLMSYGPNLPDLYRRAASYVDKILKGARPTDLPVQQPRTFELVINRKTAQTLGLTIPELVLAQATEIVE